MKRMTFIAGNVALFPKAHGKSSDQCELTPEQTQQICTVSPLLEMSATSEPVFASAKRWPAIDKLVAKINRTYVITRSFADDSATIIFLSDFFQPSGNRLVVFNHIVVQGPPWRIADLDVCVTCHDAITRATRRRGSPTAAKWTMLVPTITPFRSTWT